MVDALVADLADSVLPVLQTRPEALREAMVTARATFQRRSGGGRRRRW